MARTLTRWVSFVALAIFWAVTGSPALASGLQVLIRDKVTIQGDNITLGDIASFTPPDDERVAQLRAIIVASAPLPGREVTLNSRFLIYRLSSVRGGDPDLRFRIPKDLQVHRAGQGVSTEKMIGIFKDYVFSHSPWSRKDMEFSRVNVPDNVILPRGRITWKVKDMSDGDFVGDTCLVISFSVDGRLYRKVSVSGRVLVSRKVITTAREVPRGQIIGRQDLVQVTRQSCALRADDFKTLNQIVGKRATRTIHAGWVVTRRMVEIPPVVRKGDRVIIKAENHSFEITALGRVLEDAHAGEQVKVVNVSSGKEIFATAVGPGQVRVTF
jgi:flagellar basal body P-ring formation protein FlgA